jgi:hypothetical protein
LSDEPENASGTAWSLIFSTEAWAFSGFIAEMDQTKYFSLLLEPSGNSCCFVALLSFQNLWHNLIDSGICHFRNISQCSFFHIRKYNTTD